jgi:hypothetical protein
MLNSNQAFLLVHKLKSAPQGAFTLGVKGGKKKNRKKKFNLPQVTNKLIVTFMALYWPQGWEKKKGYQSNLGPLGPMFQPLLISRRQYSSIY